MPVTKSVHLLSAVDAEQAICGLEMTAPPGPRGANDAGECQACRDIEWIDTKAAEQRRIQGRWVSRLIAEAAEASALYSQEELEDYAEQHRRRLA